MTAPNTQTVGQSLTLQCEVTTVRGITSRVDIVWSSDGTELERMNDVSSNTMGNSLVYTDFYTISQLSTTDDDRVIQCEVVINASLSVMASDSITLDVTGKCNAKQKQLGCKKSVRPIRSSIVATVISDRNLWPYLSKAKKILLLE